MLSAAAPQPCQYTKAKAIDHMKGLLEGNYSSTNVVKKFLQPLVQTVYEQTKQSVKSIPDFKEQWLISINEMWMFFMMKMTMSIVQLPSEEDYWKEG
eukprot:15365333-Ditylum_brightwellii.AAC.2